MERDRSFWKRNKVSNLLRLPRTGGIEPFRRLELKKAVTRLDRFPISGGMEPDNRFSYKDKYVKFVRFAKVDEIVPLMLLVFKRSSVRQTKWLNSSGIGPDN